MPTLRRATAVRTALALLVAAAQAQAAQTLPIEVRDSGDGAFLAASLELTHAGSTLQLHRPAHDASPLRLEDGTWQVRVEALGHRPLQTTIEVGAEAARAVQFWLDPETAPETELAAPAAAGAVRIEGRVFDRATREPLAAASVQLEDVTTLTDATGRFHIALQLESAAFEQGRAAELHVRCEDGQVQTRRLRLVPGTHRLLLDLDASPDAIRPDHHFDLDLLQRPQDDAPSAATDAPHAPILQPPASLRVGFADAGFTTPCCVGGCSAVAVMSLETYVKRGLNDEWIASWNGHSLRAGAIAYRSYGAWHVANPRSPSYDICSSACCQMNDPDTSASTDAAVDATAGILLERSGSIFRSEYSAENNAWDDPSDGLSCSNADLSCGNGFVGSPAANWPCLADSVASGHGCFGHGRGMSQWGSQRWAINEGQRWPWIVGHYFNANGAGGGLRTAVLSSPLRIDATTSLPASAAPGSTLSLQLALSNLAAQTHPQVFLGASLYRSGVGYLNDPANDLAVALVPGANAASRPFAIPAGAPDGSYDLIVALYLDIDGNAALNSGDLALTATTLPAAVALTSSPLLFANGFETPP